jgi:hypothetical protein
MGSSLDTAALCRRWVHVQEEDTATETVYRPAGYALPPSRGRSGLVFDAAGTFKRIGIGQTDISVVTQGTWQIVDPEAGRIRIDTNGASEEMTVTSLEGDRLAIRKK